MAAFRSDLGFEKGGGRIENNERLELGEGGSRKEICAKPEEVLKIIEEVKQHFGISMVVFACLSGGGPSGSGCYILQKWSSKWM
jgi:hypothetical protein